MTKTTAKSTPPDRPWLRLVPFIGNRIADRLGDTPVVPVLRMGGVIGHLGPLRRGGITMADMAEPIDRAFATKRAKAVALAINSPGGSPVQSALIAKRIRLLAAEKELPVFAFCEDVAASGGYWLACAADEIYAEEASVVGSIGVIAAGFGFPDLLQKLGIERRVYTAGAAKSQLDPFKPENPDDVKRLLALQRDIHDQFKAWIKERRGDRLTAGERKLFSGEFWTGRMAKELGLVDDLGEIRAICRAKFGDNVQLPVVNQPKSWLQRKLGLDGRFDGRAPDLSTGSLGEDFARGAIAAAEERLAWQRYGL